MKKSIFGLMVLALMFANSCKKSSTTSNSWTFKSTTYDTYSCTGSADVLIDSSSSSGNASNFSTLSLYFYGNNLPTTGGNYPVFQYNTAPATNTEVTMVLTTGGTNATTYYATGGNGSNESVSVSISPTGLVSVNGSGIELKNAANASDSSSLTLNITQTH